MNEEGNRPDHTKCAPRFHTWGLRAPASIHGERHRSLGTLAQHRRSQWREPSSLDQVHLNNDVRLRMGKAVVRYFNAIYGLDSEPDIEAQDPAQFLRLVSTRNGNGQSPQNPLDEGQRIPDPAQQADQDQMDPSPLEALAPPAAPVQDVPQETAPAVDDATVRLVQEAEVSPIVDACPGDWNQQDEDEHLYLLEITPRPDELQLLDQTDDDDVEPLPADHPALQDLK